MNSPQNSNRLMLFLILTEIFVPLFISIVFLAFFPNVPKNTDYMLIILIMSTLCVTVFPLTIYALLTRRSIFELVPFKRLSFKNILYIMILTLLMQPAAMLASAVSGIFLKNDAADALNMLSAASPWKMLIATAVVPAICEELIFRGALLTGYRQCSRFEGAFATALFFAFMHLNLQQFLYTFILGFVFTYFVYYTRSVFSSVISHFIINGTSVCTIYLLKLMPDELVQASMEPSFKQQLQQIGVLSVYALFCSVLFFIVFKSFKRCNEQRRLNFMIPITRPRDKTSPKIVTPSFVLVILIYAAYMILNYIALPILKKYI